MNTALNTPHEFEEKAMTPLELAQRCAKAADDKKAVDITILDINPLSTLADYFVICSAPSERQVNAIIKNVQDELSATGVKASHVEGTESSAWILLDYGDVIFHCFTEAAREYYDLEGFWIDAERISF